MWYNGHWIPAFAGMTIGEHRTVYSHGLAKATSRTMKMAPRSDRPPDKGRWGVICFPQVSLVPALWIPLARDTSTWPLLN